ncbi:MAG: sugar phosphate isomerase/epimerase family protein [Alphaproteobacteria bacterium]
MNAAAEAVALSLSYHTVPELAPDAAVHAAADAGFAPVGLRLLHGQPGGGEAPLLADPALRRETMRAMAARGVCALDASGARIVPATSVAAFEPLLDAAAQMGARHVMATVDDPDAGRAADNVAALCARAAARGLTVDVEFVPWMTVASLADAAALARRVGHEALGIALDALHFHRSGSRVGELAAIAPARLRYVQLCDARGARPAGRDGLLHEATKDRLPPGEGAIDLVALLRALPRGIPVALEVPMEEEARRDPAPARLARLVAATRAVLARAYS